MNANTAASAHSDIYEPSAATVANALYPTTWRLAPPQSPIPWPFGMPAKEIIDWYQPYHTVLDKSDPPFFKWFVGGKTNITHNALDRHAASWRKNKLAYIWEGEDGEQRTCPTSSCGRK